MYRNFLIAIAALLLAQNLFSQPVTQSIRGTVIDDASGIPLFGVTVIILGTDPLLGAVSDDDGKFRIESVPVGRYDIRVSYVGYNAFIAREIIVSSGKETALDISLDESVEMLDQVEIKATSNKSETLNSMTTVSARQVNMEEANRYAGGFDDPARLVSSYAGVTSSIGNNAIAIRGNSPKGLLWRMEGVQIPNPNHFADYITLGGGAVTALSSQTMGTSDFFTGAFPAEYGNALSGVFDISMRTGNTDKHEYTFQAGIVGIDAASEGPFKKGSRSSYLFNYRYSTLGLLAPILPQEMGIITYQDLSFKLNFPSDWGTFSVWGIGAYDFQGKDAINDSADWKSADDSQEFSTLMTMGAAGISFKKIIGKRTYIQATAAATQNGMDWSQSRYDTQMIMQPENDVTDFRWHYIFQAHVNHKFSARHTNRSGIICDWLWYDTQIRNADDFGELMTYANDRDHTCLWQAYSQSKFSLTDRFTVNAGLHVQYLALNGNFALEPRLGARWNFLPGHTLSVAYGLHSQVEKLELYLVEQQTSAGIIMPNKDLEFNKSHHFVLGYEYMINENTVFKAEPYLQLLFDVPVVPGSYISTINLDDVWNFDDSLVNTGRGRNFGIDLTLERYLDNGFYYLVTASFFDSKYSGGDGLERNTRYNKGYVMNFLAGKEWKIGDEKKNFLGANIRFTYSGGDYIIPADEGKSLDEGSIVYDYNHAYSEKLTAAPVLSVSASYRINKRNHSSAWSFQLINALGYKEFQEYYYDEPSKSVQKKYDTLIIPNISYKIEF